MCIEFPSCFLDQMAKEKEFRPNYFIIKMSGYKNRFIHVIKSLHIGLNFILNQNLEMYIAKFFIKNQRDI